MSKHYTKRRATFGGRAIAAAALFALTATVSMAAQGISSDWDDGAPLATSAPAVPAAPSGSSTAAAQLAASGVEQRGDSPAMGQGKSGQAVAAGQSSEPAQHGKGGEYRAPTWGSYYAAVDSIRADTEKAKAELDNLKIHHALDQARIGVFDQSGSSSTGLPASPLGAVGMMATNAASPSGQADRSPVVREVSMVDGRWTAVIQLPTGARITVHQGETVRGVGRVESIALNDVEVSAGGKTSSLEFASEGSAEAVTTTQGARAAMPPVPFGIH